MQKVVRGDAGDKAGVTVLYFEYIEPLLWRTPSCECGHASVVRGLFVTPLGVTGTAEWASVKWGERDVG